jgi:phosphocarrier protein
MMKKDITVINKLGLHARAAAKLVSLASTFQSAIKVSKDNREVNGKSIMGVMMLAASQDSTIQITAEGEDEQQAIDELEELINDRFGEDQ